MATEEKGNPKFDPLLVQGNCNKFYIYAQTFKILTLKTHEIKHASTVKRISEKKLGV